jgi:hypothetical protein
MLLHPMTQRLVDKKAVIPLVSTIPVLAILWAFSLGPVPEKRVINFYESTEASTAALEPVRAQVVPIFVGDLAKPDLAHRAEVIRFVGNGRHPEAIAVLGRIAADANEPVAIRDEARQAIERIGDSQSRAGL